LKRIGIFGGMFNPVHTAHLIMAECVREQVHLDTVLFIPSANPPHKEADELPEASVRLDMLRLAIEGNEYFEASDIEIELSKNGRNYTVDTLLALREKYSGEEGQVKFYLIIGMDQLIQLHTWKDPGKLFFLSEVVVMNRPGYLQTEVENEYSRRVIYVPAPNIDISSTEIRHRTNEKKSIKYLVPHGVEKFIYENNLYKQS
jgi:nicotinate-nucleotide adenylyltransferase